MFFIHGWVLPILLFTVPLAAESLSAEQEINQALESFSLSLSGGLKDLQLKSKNLREHEGRKTLKLRFSDATHTIFLAVEKPIPEEQARVKLGFEIKSLYSLYHPKKNPYRGQLTSLIACEAEKYFYLEKIVLLDTSTEAVVAGANNRFSFGACDSNSVKYWGTFIIFFHSKTNSLIKVNIFSEASKRASFEKARSQLLKFSSQFLKEL